MEYAGQHIHTSFSPSQNKAKEVLSKEEPNFRGILSNALYTESITYLLSFSVLYPFSFVLF